MTCAHCGTELPDTALFCGECGRSLAPGRTARRTDTVAISLPVAAVPEPAPEPAIAPVAPAPVVAAPVDEALSAAPVVAAPTVAAPIDEDTEATRLVPKGATGARFILQFSTGESVTVFGTGLIGRNPAMEPGEFFDQLVTIVDPSKSVSKTHLEFGQEAGAFYVADRYSANGSLVREPDSEQRRCEPGRRYRVVRGTRVSIGEQFFVVS